MLVIITTNKHFKKEYSENVYHTYTRTKTKTKIRGKKELMIQIYKSTTRSQHDHKSLRRQVCFRFTRLSAVYLRL